MEKYRISKKTIIMIIIAIITFSNSFLIAKYTSSLNGNSLAAIAKWNVTYDTSDNVSDTLNLISGNETKDYIIKVTSTSDVSANYSIVLSNVPSEMEVTFDNRITKTPVDNTIEFDNIGSFTGNDMNTTFTHTLTFNAPLESNIADTTDVGININFEQID